MIVGSERPGLTSLPGPLVQVSIPIRLSQDPLRLPLPASFVRPPVLLSLPLSPYSLTHVFVDQTRPTLACGFLAAPSVGWDTVRPG